MRRTSARIAQLRRHLDRVKWRDTQAAETYRLLQKAMPRAHYVLSDCDRVLRDYYTDEHINQAVYRSNPFFASLKKEVDSGVEALARKLNRTVYYYATEHCPPDRAYMVGLHLWLPESKLDESATFKTEEAMPRIEERVVREFPQKIQTNPPNNAYREGWERVFGDKKKEAPEEVSRERQAVRNYLAAGGEPSPIGWYGVIKLDDTDHDPACESLCTEGADCNCKL